MPSNDYIFVTEWQVPAPIDVIYEILKSGRDYSRWWPDVYLEARAERPDADGRVGDRVALLTKGWLPYRLRWTAELVRLERPTEIELTASGDFAGRGLWHLEPRDDGTHIDMTVASRAASGQNGPGDPVKLKVCFQGRKRPCQSRTAGA